MPSTRLPPIPVEIVEAFRPIAPTVETFARERNLVIERYRRGKAVWELRFARRVGGEAVITLSYRERTGHVLDLSVTWWLDDRERQTRRLRSQKIAVYDRRAAPVVLRNELDEALSTIDGWTSSDLGEPHGPFRLWTEDENRTTLPIR